MTEIKQVSPETLAQWLEEDKAIVIDVREAKEVSNESIPKARNITAAQFSEQLSFFSSADKPIVFQCQSGKRSMMACNEMVKLDVLPEVWNLEGGILAWKASNLPTNVGAAQG